MFRRKRSINILIGIIKVRLLAPGKNDRLACSLIKWLIYIYIYVRLFCFFFFFFIGYEGLLFGCVLTDHTEDCFRRAVSVTTGFWGVTSPICFVESLKEK